ECEREREERSWTVVSVHGHLREAESAGHRRAVPPTGLPARWGGRTFEPRWWTASAHAQDRPRSCSAAARAHVVPGMQEMADLTHASADEADEEIAAALDRLRRGAPDGMERLIPLVYAELRRMAHRQRAA